MAHITDVLKKPVLTEKSLTLMETENKYTFDVEVKSNKVEIKQAVEAMFGVKVKKVRTMHVKPKTKRVGKYVGKTNRRKKAIVTLAEGEKINLFKD
jgi:Ribosomal protein L23